MPTARHIDTLAAYKDFKAVFGHDRAEALALAIGKVQADPAAAPQAVADLERCGFTRPQAESVVGQTILSTTGKKPPLAYRATDELQPPEPQP